MYQSKLLQLFSRMLQRCILQQGWILIFGWAVPLILEMELQQVTHHYAHSYLKTLQSIFSEHSSLWCKRADFQDVADTLQVLPCLIANLWYKQGLTNLSHCSWVLSSWVYRDKRRLDVPNHLQAGRRQCLAITTCSGRTSLCDVEI